MIIPPSPGSCVLTIQSANTYNAYPTLHCLDRIPESQFSILDTIWRRSISNGRDVNFYHLHNVFMVKEGLVFDQSGNLIDISRTYHSDDEIAEGHRMVEASIASGEALSFPRGILAKSRGASNYGHFLVEMLPRAWLARNRLNLVDWPAIVDSCSPAVLDIARQALAQAGFGDQVISTNQSPVFFTEIICVHGLTSHADYLSPITMQCLDNIAENVVPLTQRNIYASRGDGSPRDFDNVPAISATLKTLGFTEHFTGAMSFRDQVSAFKGADRVVGVSGAALSNLVFCRPGTQVFNFTPSSALEVLFWMICEARRLEYHEIRCRELGPSVGALPWDRKIQVSPRELKALLASKRR